MAANPDLLTHLADIYEPELLIPWQMTIGHWLLVAIALLLLVVALWRGYRYWQTGKPRRAALAELKQIDWQDPRAAAAINQLLKRLIQHYYPHHPLLSCATREWQHCLQRLLPATMPLPDLEKLLYQAATAHTAETQKQWWQASQHIISHFSVKTLAKVNLPARGVTTMTENKHA